MAEQEVLVLIPGNRMFGQERALVRLSESLRRRGYRVHALVHRDWGEEIALDLGRNGIESSQLPLGSLWSFNRKVGRGQIFKNVLAVVTSSVTLWRLMRARHFSYLILGNATFGVYLLPALWVLNIVVIYRHGDEPALHSAFHRFVTWLLFRRVDKHVANCDFIRRQVNSRFPSIDAEVIYNVAEKGTQAPDDAPVDTTVSSVVYVGQISRQKGVDVLANAFRLLAPRHANLTLELIGDFPGVGLIKEDAVLKETLDALVSDFPSRVHLRGFVEDPRPYLRRATVHVCPSVYEDPSPNVILEAKEVGVPSVVFDVGGISELVEHQVDGFVCADRGAKSLATGIEYFLVDDKRQALAGRVAMDRARVRFGQDRFDAQWAAVVGDCVRRSRRSP